MAQYVIGLPVSNFNIAAADVSGDGKVTIYDAYLIAQYAMGRINEFPVQNNVPLQAILGHRPALN